MKNDQTTEKNIEAVSAEAAEANAEVKAEMQEEAAEVKPEADKTAQKGKKEKKTKGEKKQTKAGKVINIIVNVVLVSAIIIAAICTYSAFVEQSGNGTPSIFGIRLMSVQTESMMPKINPGDLAVEGPVNPEKLRPGDIITYWTTINGEKKLNTHYIVNIYASGEGENRFLFFETKGEGDVRNDDATVHQNALVGKYWFRVPSVGKALDYLKTPMGFFLIVVIPVFAFFIYHLVRFFRVLFEYQNVKNRLKFELERGKTEDMIAAQKEAEIRRETERAAMEAELREKLRAEILEDMKNEQNDTKNE